MRNELNRPDDLGPPPTLADRMKEYAEVAFEHSTYVGFLGLNDKFVLSPTKAERLLSANSNANTGAEELTPGESHTI